MTVLSVEHPAARPAAPLGVDELGELLVSVNEVTRRLQATHEALRCQVATLQGELHDANEQLRRSRTLAALGEMAAGIAHEIRNPLGSILLNSQLLREDLRDRPAQAATCEKISRAVEGLDVIVRDVLLFARQTHLRREPTDAESVVQLALEQSEAVLHAGGVEVVRVRCADRLPLSADPSQLAQTLANLIRNGVEAMIEAGSPERRIVVRTARRRRRMATGRREDRAVISIEDTGPGIPPDALPRIFNPFFTTRAGGTGLGLAIVHRTIDAHDGEVTASNTERGGARLDVWLPIASRECGRDSSRPLAHADIHTAQSSLAAAVSRRIATERRST